MELERFRYSLGMSVPAILSHPSGLAYRLGISAPTEIVPTASDYTFEFFVEMV